jgi:hypothetical protein
MRGEKMKFNKSLFASSSWSHFHLLIEDVQSSEHKICLVLCSLLSFWLVCLALLRWVPNVTAVKHYLETKTTKAPKVCRSGDVF